MFGRQPLGGFAVGVDLLTQLHQTSIYYLYINDKCTICTYHTNYISDKVLSSDGTIAPPPSAPLEVQMRLYFDLR